MGLSGPALIPNTLPHGWLLPAEMAGGEGGSRGCRLHRSLMPVQRFGSESFCQGELDRGCLPVRGGGDRQGQAAAGEPDAPCAPSENAYSAARVCPADTSRNPR